MEEVGILEARNNFSALVERAEKGENVIITRHGKPVVKMVAVELENEEERRRRAREAVEAIWEMRKEVKPLGDITIKDLINEGRKY
ncbi:MULTISPECIES: type II toxin-antitoxin system prevent-host-death family antitoxin [unclassified Roseitalea]|uniref:type II toxin-antitoxin system Phd/YefM family antitoxin n=1 Tax=unclassified Roseitalea TaxID=2639107 RepID=UPI00273E94B8|nr:MULTISPECIES: type II toxin-antitoxin system prevent-host-death family antitoxin [unclassified Roseitalea]